jgi:hypothetical protein
MDTRSLCGQTAGERLSRACYHGQIAMGQHL